MGSLGPLELVLIMLFLTVPASWVLSMMWVAQDARQRGSNSYLVAFLVAVVAWPLSLIVWILIRPKDYE